jgi:hypothetical protein
LMSLNIEKWIEKIGPIDLKKKLIQKYLRLNFMF